MFAAREQLETTSSRSFSVRAIADEVAITDRAVRKWIVCGVRVCGHVVRLKAHRVGGSWRVKREDWQQFRQECDQEAWRHVAESQRPRRRRRPKPVEDAMA